MRNVPNQLPDPAYPAVTPPAGAGVAPSVGADHLDVRRLRAHTVRSSPCIGCGAILPDAGGPIHDYMESSPACWSTYSEVLAREYADRRLFEGVHRLTVDSYAAQHPGRASAQCIQSVAGHLISLCAIIENGASNEWATKLIREAVRVKGRFTWLQPPQFRGSITVVDVWKANGTAGHEELVRDWASSVWAAWSIHHEIVRHWYSSIRGAQSVSNQLPDPISPSVTPPAGTGGAPSVAADRQDVRLRRSP